jgi:hypothetical protein
MPKSKDVKHPGLPQYSSDQFPVALVAMMQAMISNCSPMRAASIENHVRVEDPLKRLQKKPDGTTPTPAGSLDANW